MTVALEMTEGEIRLESGALQAVITQQGGSIRELVFGDQPIFVPAGGPHQSVGCFPLLPFGNRLEGNAFSLNGQSFHLEPNMPPEPLYRHGDGWLGWWEIAEQRADRLVLTFRYQARTASPYAYSARQEISVGDDTLTVRLSLRSEAEVCLPFGLGLHPFFIRTPQTQLQTAAQLFWHERDDHLPSHAMKVPKEWNFETLRALPDAWANNALQGWSGHARVIWPERALAAEIMSEDFRILMLYMPTARTDFFCLEPMTHLPNGHHLPNLGELKLLSPGQELSAVMRIKLSRY
ncbi:aldose 1-epimerase [Rhizobium oryzicola]|uniref:Aldose 1-epimerase n=1 Tax=Rhizobium oryzicola TaxID=1232668 RepID=A0ABT8SYM8_9HYPH|nr:aldose 1-epimerase [Rhizobium oryzicola]MDO1583574.1 aldose 1-epimerase [Rhizobium oryzicola]